MGALSAAGTARTRDRRVRVLLALACALLTGLTLLSPAFARDGGGHAHHRAAVKIVTPASADQSATSVRLDQPVAALAGPQRATFTAGPAEDVGTAVATDQSSVEAGQPRGPPVSR